MRLFRVARNILAFILFFSSSAHADFYICNHSTEEIDAAMAVNTGGNSWTSKGWYKIASGSCGHLLSGPSGNRYLYYAILTPTRTLLGEGANAEHSWPFCVMSEAFQITDDDCKPWGGKSLRFIRFDRGDNASASNRLNIEGEGGRVAADIRREDMPKPIGSGVPPPRSNVASQRTPQSGPSSAQSVAQSCASRSGADVQKFAACASGQVVLPRDQHALIECAEAAGKDPRSFADCAGPRLLSRQLSEEAQVTARCAFASKGRAGEFSNCIGDRITRDMPRVQRELIDCARRARDISELYSCGPARNVLNQIDSKSKAALECIANAKGGNAALTECANPVLDKDTALLVACAAKAKADQVGFKSCLGGLFSQQLSSEQQAIVACAQNAQDNIGFGLCAGERLFGSRLNAEQRAALECLADSQGQGGAFAMCAVNKLMNGKLNIEQQIALECVAQSGGQPYAAAGCAAAKLTGRELQKCIQNGIGGNGCFGDRNDLVGKNGWTSKTFQSVVNDARYGAGPSNDVVGREGFVVRNVNNARNDVTKGPGKGNDACKILSAFGGGC